MTHAHVTGAALTPFNRRRDGTNWRDWATEAFAMAMTQATLDHGDITALIVASESDHFTGQLNPAGVLASDLGLVGAAAWRVEGGGASGQLAVQAGVQAVLSGIHRHVAVVGVDPSASGLPGDQIRALYGLSFDALAEGPLNTTATAIYALSWQAFAAQTGADTSHLAQITIQNRANACANPGAHLPRMHTAQDIAQSPMIASPYRRLHCSPLSDGAAAIIISASHALPPGRRSAPRVAGIGAATAPVHLGARTNPGAFDAKTLAMKRACAMADITPQDIEMAELYDAYAGAQLQAIAALHLADNPLAALAQGTFAPDGARPINLSGGLMGQGAPVGATGVGQTATCAQALEGVYPGKHPAKPPRIALADTHGGIATTCAITVLAAP